MKLQLSVTRNSLISVMELNTPLESTNDFAY